MLKITDELRLLHLDLQLVEPLQKHIYSLVKKKKKKGKLTIKKLPCEKQADIFPSCSCSQRDIKASV